MLTTQRDAVKTLLATATGWTAHASLPERLIPPAVVMTPGSPYIEPGDTFGSLQVRLVASLVSKTAANKVVSEGLDAALEDAIVAVINAGHTFESAGQPYSLEANNGQFLAVDITFTITTTP